MHCNNHCMCNNMCGGCYHHCPCPPCHHPKCSKEELYDYLGKAVYKQLQTLIFPTGHPSLDESLCLLAQGKPLPPGHPTLQEIMCLAFNCNPKPSPTTRR